MTEQKAIEILHPDTTLKALEEIRYYAGFRAGEAELAAVDEACIMACDALKKQIPVKPIHVIYTPIKTKGYHGRKHHMVYCGVCGKFTQRVAIGDKYCRECGTRIDWSKDECTK